MVELKNKSNRLINDILALLKLAFWVLIVSLGITVALISQIRIYAKLAGSSSAMADYQNKLFRFYDHKTFEMPEEMESLVEVDTWNSVLFYDFGAEVYIKEYNNHMKLLLSHHPKFKEELGTSSEEQKN